MISSLDKSQFIAKELSSCLEEIKKEKEMKKTTTKKKEISKGITQLERKKILKLFSYANWTAYMKWIDEKLEESGQDLESFTEIEKDTPEKSEQKSINLHNSTTKKKTLRYVASEQQMIREKHQDTCQNQLALLETQNKKLITQNLALKQKLSELHHILSFSP